MSKNIICYSRRVATSDAKKTEIVHYYTRDEKD